MPKPFDDATKHLIETRPSFSRIQEEDEDYAKEFAKGRVEEARRLFLRLGEKRFGSPDEGIQFLASCSVLPILEALIERLFEIETWDELLAD